MTRRDSGLMAMCCLLVSVSAQAAQEPQTLAPGTPVEREIAGGQTHTYQLTLAAGQYLHVVVDQRGIDVVVGLFGPDGKQIIEVDSPNGTQGPEPVFLVTEAAGSYRLEVRSLEKEAKPGRYEVKIAELRPALPLDRNRIAAQKSYAEGKLLYAQGDALSLHKAIEKFQESLPHWRAVGDHQSEAGTLNYIGGAYNSLRERQKALEFYTQSLLLRRVVSDRDGEAQALNSIGWTYYSLSDHQKALEYYTQALPLWRAVGDRNGEAHTLENIGAAYGSLRENLKALEYCTQALPLWRAMGARGGEASTLTYMGVAYRWLGESQMALESYTQSLALWRAVGARGGEAITLTNISTVYDSLGEPQKALDFLNQALSLHRVTGNRPGEATTLNNIGAAYRSLGEHQKAIEFYTQALMLRRAVGDRRGEAITLNNMGLVYSLLGEKQKAQELLNQALMLSQAEGDQAIAAVTLSNIGELYISLGEHQRASELLDQALLLFRLVNDLRGEASALTKRAIVDRNLGKLSEARTKIEAALSITESLRTKVDSQELRSSFFASVQDRYDFYIDLLMRLHQEHPAEGNDAAALQASERARARSLLELLSESRVDIRQGVDPELLTREHALQQQLNAREANRTVLLSGKHTEIQAATAAKEMTELTSRYQEVEAQIRATSPRYAALTQPQPRSVSEIQQQVLDQDTMLLEYALGPEHSYLWAVTPNSVTSYQLPPRAEIEVVVRRVVEFLTARQPRPGETEVQHQARIREADANYPAQSSALSHILLDPVAGQLRGVKRLEIESKVVEIV